MSLKGGVKREHFNVFSRSNLTNLGTCAFEAGNAQDTTGGKVVKTTVQALTIK